MTIEDVANVLADGGRDDGLECRMVPKISAIGASAGRSSSALVYAWGMSGGVNGRYPPRCATRTFVASTPNRRSSSAHRASLWATIRETIRYGRPDSNRWYRALDHGISPCVV